MSPPLGPESKSFLSAKNNWKSFQWVAEPSLWFGQPSPLRTPSGRFWSIYPSELQFCSALTIYSETPSVIKSVICCSEDVYLTKKKNGGCVLLKMCME